MRNFLFNIAFFIQQMPIFVSEISIKQLHICIVRAIYEIESKLVQPKNEIELIKMSKIRNNIGRLNALAPRMFSLLFLLILNANSFAQGWEKYYDFGGILEINDIKAAADEGFIFTGSAQDMGFVVFRLNPEGDTVWTRTDLVNAQNQAGNAIVESSNGDIIVGGYCESCGDFGKDEAILIRLDRYGNEIWQKNYGTGGDERILDLIELGNGDIAFVGYSINADDNKEIYVARTASNGDIVWIRTFTGSADPELEDEGRAILETQGGDLIIAASSEIETNLPQPFVLSLTAAGDSTWAFRYGDGTNDTEVRDITYAKNSGLNDGYVLCGSKLNPPSSFDYYFQRIDLNGNTIGSEIVQGSSLRDEANSIDITKGGNFAIGGSTGITAQKILPTILTANSDLSVISESKNFSDPNGNLILGFFNTVSVTDKNQVVGGGYRSERDLNATSIDGSFYAALSPLDVPYYSNVVQGNVFADLNNDCNLNNLEAGLNDWKIVLKSGDKTFYATTDENGDFEIFCGKGTFVLSIETPNESWSPCFNAYNFNLNSDFIITELDFPVQTGDDCIYPELSIANKYLQPCDFANYTIKYENTGSQDINFGFVDVDFGENLTYVSADIPGIDQGDNKYRFNVGSIQSLSKNEFDVRVFVECDEPLGAAHRIEAEIFPNDLCADDDPSWDGSSLENSIRLDAANEQLHFKVENAGIGITSEIQASVIIEDFVIYRVLPDENELLPGDSITTTAPANGSTYTIITPQSIGHPGDRRPKSTIERFAPGGQTPSLGFATQFPEDDYDPFKAISHTENIQINTFENQFKRGYPKGFDQDRKIDSKTDLTYQINFRNTGDEEAIRVVIRDTISQHLDPSTILMGASSHDYNYEIVGDGILKITFEDLNLPPGGSAAAEGFVSYRISQKPENPIGTLIKSSAAIYFDFLTPEYVEETCHLVAGDLYNQLVFIKQPLPELETVEAYPNPFNEFTNIEFRGDINIVDGKIAVYNSSGLLLRMINFSGNQVRLNKSDFPAGALFFHISEKDKLIATGQLIAQ